MKAYSYFIFIFFIGCTTFSQVYKTKPTSPINTANEAYIFENDTLKIEYDFWSEHGVLDFTIYNKLNVPLYIDWRKSAFVRNGTKLDYYVDQETTISTAYSAFLYGKWNLWPAAAGKTNSTSVKTKPERITFIAPKSNIQRNQFVLFPLAFTKFQGESKKVRSSLDSTKSATLLFKNLTIENSPVVFRNFLTFSTTENFSSEFYVDNGFYISEILQMTQNQFQGKYKYDKYDGSPYGYEYPYSYSRWFFTTNIDGAYIITNSKSK